MGITMFYTSLAVIDRIYLMMLIWNSSSWIVFHDPDRKSRHQANALILVSRSTSSVLPSRKDSASESSSQLAPDRGLGVRTFLSLTPSVLASRFVSTGVPVFSAVTAGMFLKRPGPGFSALSKPPSPPTPPLLLLLVTFRLDCIVSFRAKSKGKPVWNVGLTRKQGVADKRRLPVKLLSRKSQT